VPEWLPRCRQNAVLGYASLTIGPVNFALLFNWTPPHVAFKKGGMDGKKNTADVLYFLGSISIIASLVLGLVWVFTEWVVL
jgi:hypothetical protein